MDGWTDGQLALFSALGEICEKIGPEGTTELAKSITKPNTQSFVKELQSLRKETVLVDDLQNENRSLRARLEASKNAANIGDGVTGAALARSVSRGLENSPGVVQSSKRSGDTNPPKAPFYRSSSGGNVTFEVEYRRLVNQHNILVRYNDNLSSARNNLEKKLREVLTSGRNWRAYAHALEKKVANLKVLLSSRGIPLDKDSRELSALKARAQPYLSPPRTDTTDVSSSSHLPPAPAPITPILDRDTAVAIPEDTRKEPRPSTTDYLLNSREVESSLSPQKLPNNDEAILANHGDFATNSYPLSLPPHHSSSTQGDAEDGNNPADGGAVDRKTSPIRTEISSDPPIFLYSRSVKKRRSNQARKFSTPIEPKIKVEVITSSPIGLAGLLNFESYESLDLDDIGEKSDTPKKKRQRHLQSDTCLETSKPDNRNNNFTPHRIDLSILRHEKDIHLAPRASVLQPSSPNRQMSPRTSGKERQGKRRRLDDCVQRAGQLFKDGEDYLATSIVSKHDLTSGGTNKTLPGEIPGRLSHLTDLLEQPSPLRSVSSPSQTTKTLLDGVPVVQRQLSNSKKMATPSSRRHIAGADADTDPSSTVQDPILNVKSRSIAKIRVPGTPEYKDIRPLRVRHLQELSLENFKVNPNYNQGYDYAFSDVVRGRQQRMCLSGCTRLECCGDKFRKFIEVTRARGGEQTASQEERDQLLLEEYMGDNKGKLRTMSQAERDETLIRAKARELANKAGKHRHAYERRRSPPGFWRADFPDTQEMRADRLEAVKLERKLVQQRYEEAMRPGGKWLFRDE